MVNMNNDNDDVKVETTNDTDVELDNTEIVEEEEQKNDKIKKLKSTINRLEEEKKHLQDDLQRVKADFLNARKRLEEERARDRVRLLKQHVEELLPLCDSFEMAMKDKSAWEKADPSWRKGVEGINTQLNKLLESYGVTAIEPIGQVFDPHRDESIGIEEVGDVEQVDKVMTVVQRGYKMSLGGESEVIRHARVTIGILKN
jgi:molecular chaperone GrpE